MPTVVEDALAEEKDRLSKIVDRSISILTLDIETSPHLAYSFNVWNANIGPDKIVDPSRVLMVGAKWYGQRNTLLLSERALGHEEMIQRAWTLVDQADLIVHYNGRKFDMRHLRREWLAAGLPPPSPYKQVDLLQVVRKQFAYGSNKLDAVSQTLGVGEKIKHEGFGLWRSCLAGDQAAWGRMERYCRGDVKLTERLYDRLRPWITGHPHTTTANDLRCNKCGSADLEQLPQGYRAVVIEYAAYRCRECKGLVRASYPKRVALTRGIE